MIKAELSDLFPYLPERSRFKRRRRNLCYASENSDTYCYSNCVLGITTYMTINDKTKYENITTPRILSIC